MEHAQGNHAGLLLLGHCSGFDFEEQVGTADVANDRYPGPVEAAFYRIENFLDLGRFAVGYDLNQIFFAGLHFAENSANVLYCCIYLARSISDIRGGSIGID